MEGIPKESIIKLVIKQCLAENFIPTIKAKLPKDCNKHIVIQQDNTRPHIHDSDLHFIMHHNWMDFT